MCICVLREQPLITFVIRAEASLYTHSYIHLTQPYTTILCRCGIPVVIMGETGCGKTRLVQYMCDLERQGIVRRNMMILKVRIVVPFTVAKQHYIQCHDCTSELQVHGGITEDDIEQFVKKAHEEAVENRKHCLNTVVFFDEANTTEAIGLIKEIMCDRRLHGKRIAKDLKIIATCNPYRKYVICLMLLINYRGYNNNFCTCYVDTQMR